MKPGTVIQRPKRWDNPFDPTLTEADVERIMALDMFREMDDSRFPPTATLKDIIRNDTQLRQFRRGDIIIRSGDYGNTAFLVVSGSIYVVVPPPVLPEHLLGRARTTRKRGIWDAISQLWTNPKVPEARDPTRYGADAMTATRVLGRNETHVYVRNIDAVLDNYQTIERGPGSMFGEIAALTRSARTTTIVAKDDVEVLEIRRQGIRDIRQRVPSFRQSVDNLYRVNTLRNHFRKTPLFQDLDDDVIKTIAEETLFETFGDFDWHITYKRHVESPPGERLAAEPIIVEEGDYPDGLLMIVSGAARITRRVNHGHRTLGYVGPGTFFGLDEITHNWREGGESVMPLQNTLRCVGYTDILRVPTTIIEKHVLPNLTESDLPPPIEPDKDTVSAPVVEWRGRQLRRRRMAEIDTDTLEFLVENRYINGTATMLIDLDRCIRCDSCVEACAKGHNNNPRFIRHGRTFDHYMVANACMHCTDPVCMIGCPTGAIHRSQSGEVVINDDTCIGCSTCATNCPYDNIRMVEIRDRRGNFIIDDNTNAPIVKATKCDLCIDQPGGPACQRACPHDALVRIDMKRRGSLARWLNR